MNDKLPPRTPPSPSLAPDHQTRPVRESENLSRDEKRRGKYSHCERAPSTKKYFSSSRRLRSERSRSTGDSSLLYQFYPSEQSLQHRFNESWHQHNQNSEGKRSNKHKLGTLKNITEYNPPAFESSKEFNESSFKTLAEIRSKGSERKFASTDSSERISKNSSFAHLYEKLSTNPHFRLTPSITDSQSTVYKSSSFKSSSSFSPSTLSSISSIYASTPDYAQTEDELDELTSDSFDLFPSHDDPELVDEFFLFPYDVLDADFDTICVELSRYSPDIEQCLHTPEKIGHLKAAKASDAWNTLWIYRGMIMTVKNVVDDFL